MPYIVRATGALMTHTNIQFIVEAEVWVVIDSFAGVQISHGFSLLLSYLLEGLFVHCELGGPGAFLHVVGEGVGDLILIRAFRGIDDVELAEVRQLRHEARGCCLIELILLRSLKDLNGEPLLGGVWLCFYGVLQEVLIRLIIFGPIPI